MPRRKTVTKLNRLCLEVIAENLEILIWSFGDLSAATCEILLKLLNYKVCNEYLLYFIKPGVKELNLCYWKFDQDVFKIMGKCVTLTHLNISSCRNILPSNLRILINKLPNLTDLNLSMTTCNDSVMAVIGSSCPKIKNLELSDCFISDKGVYQLCLENGSTSCSLNINYLNIWNTCITQRGVLIALLYLKHLKKLHYEEIERPLTLLQSIWIPSIGHLELETIELFNGISNLAPILKLLCPNIENITIGWPFIFDTDLKMLIQFKQLKVLSISNELNGGIKFANGILPILKKIGDQLTDLTLTSISRIDILLIGVNCANLRVLRLENIKSFLSSTRTIAGKVCPMPFGDLREVFVSCYQTEIPGKEIVAIFRYCVFVEKCVFRYCQKLTDEVITTILKSNPLMYLKEFELFRCHEITSLSTMKLLKRQKFLSVIDLSACRKITAMDKQHMKMFIKENNLDVFLTSKFETLGTGPLIF